VRGYSEGRRYHKGKRVFDVVCSSVLLFLGMPLLLAIWLAVRLTSRGPAIFRQYRMGYRGRVFMMFKFRTMVKGTARHLDLVVRGDPRVTPVGRLLRATHLDELPQLFNVLRGDMSMVGPRPDELGIAEHLKRTVPGYAECLSMVPGLTGLSQLVGREKINRRGRRFEVWLHRQYRRKMCLAYDMLVILLTIPHMLRQRGV
jgi:lipopolysaccharide/colanic/teichoic acid biosynthesis glycosyltransferase